MISYRPKPNPRVTTGVLRVGQTGVINSEGTYKGCVVLRTGNGRCVIIGVPGDKEERVAVGETLMNSYNVTPKDYVLMEEE